MTVWSDAQKKAIYTKNKNILVSASAGSGKTTVLIARLLHLIQDEKIEINKILAMTFTEAAANEMKKRLSASLNEALLKSKDENEKAYLQKQLASVSNAYISTIHGFCLNIIQNYYYVIGLPKERISNIMDDAGSASLLEESMYRTIQHFVNDSTYMDLCVQFSSKANSDENLKQAILSLFNLANAKSEPYAFLESCKQNKEINSLKDYPDAIKTYFYDYFAIQVDSLLNSLEEYRLILAENEEDKKIAAVESKAGAILKAQQYLLNEEYMLFKQQFIIACANSIPSIKDHEHAKHLRKQITDLEDSINAILFDEDKYILFSNTNKAHINTLVDVVSYFLHTYETLKENAQCIDFSDMEHYALQILKAENNMVANIYKEMFVEIMVDEFQDSNDVQDDLVHLICKDNNVFRVGDIKQSIYGFRHATPEIMRNLMNNATSFDEILYLSSNYRSKKSIVDFNNALFTQLMNIKGFASSFKQEDCTLCGLETQAQDCTPVQFHILDEPFFKEYVKNTGISNDEIKADYIANDIAKKVKEHASFKDFVVLIKTNAKAEYLRDAFEKHNIPYFISMKQGFYDSNAIASVISFLKALQNPYDDLEFCAFLLSPFMQKQNGDLVNAKLNKNKSYYEHFKENNEINDFEELYAHKDSTKVSVLLNKIYQFHQYYEQYTSAQERSNLDKLYEIATNYEKKQYLTLSQFLAIIEQSKDAKIGEAIPIGNEDDVVRVMSIHQSKGLQFPYVYLYSVSNVSIMDIQGNISYDDTLKIGMNYIDPYYRYNAPSVERIAINHKITQAALEEEMRLLYVATTRAQNELHIVDFGKKGAKSNINRVEIYKKKGFTAWILQTLYHIKDSMQYYKEHAIDSLWNDIILENKHSEKKELLRYTFESEEIITNSPSENEVVSYRPRPFSFHEEYAMQRGTNLHKMVEVLPNTSWDETMLRQYSTQYDIYLNEHDTDILLALNTHPIYKEAMHTDIHHEFPFMIKENNSITHGYMDFVSIGENKVIMIDFKSDRNIDENELITRYKDQIDAYTHALHILYSDKIIESYIYSFELKTMISM